MRFKWALALALWPSLAWGTTYTSAASGNWNSSATWSPSGVPGSGDTVTLANSYTVTIPVSTTATVSSIACSSATGTGILIINGTLDYKGSTLNQCSANPWICNSCTLTADDASTSIQWNIGYANCTTAPCALLVLNGTSSSPVTVNGTGGSTWSFAGGGYQDAGAIQATWGSFANCGTSSIACINVNSYYYVGLKASITYSTFTSTGLVGLGNVNPGNSTSFIFNQNTIITPIDSSGKGLSITTAGNDSTIACQIGNNYLEGETFETIGNSSYWGTDDGCIVSGNAFIGSATVSPYVGNLSGHATGHFDGNLFYNQVAAGTVSNPSGSVTRSVVLLVPDESGGGSHLYGMGAGQYAATTFNGGTIERQYNSASGADGTSSCFYNGGYGFAQTIENWVTIPAPNGGSPCMLSNVIGSSIAGASYTVLHNTAMVTPAATGGGFGPCAGEGSTAAAGLYPQCSNNMFWSTSSAAGVGAGWFNSFTPTANTFTVADYNGWYNVTGSPYTAKYIPNSAAYASTPGTHDVTANPNFPGCYNGSTTAVGNCNFSTWGTVQGISVSSWTDILNQFKIMNSASPGFVNNASILNYYYWVRQGFTPTNAALHGTASDGGDIGGVPYYAPPSYFSGLLTNSTDYTTSGSWTTPSVPASGASYTDSIFGITATRIPAVTNCPANSTYNPSGDCAVTNTQMQVDYAKTVPWSVNDNYYIADSNGWLFLYSRSSMGVYTFIRTLRTYCGTGGTCTSNYGSTRDYGSGDGSFSANLWGDGSNWLWANNKSSNPNVIYYTGGSSSNPNAFQLKAYDAGTDSISVVHDFTSTIATVNGWGTCPATVNSIDMQREGNQSDDDRWWVFGVNNGSSYNQWCAVLVYDKLSDTVVALQSIEAGGMCGASACPTQPNWVGSSPSGKYAIVNWDGGSSDNSWTPHEGTEVYSNTLAYLGVASAYDGHGDVGWDANGLEVFVTSSSAPYAYGNYSFQACYLDVVNTNPGSGGCRRYLSIPCTWSNSTCPVGGNTRGNTFFISMRGTHGALGQMALSTQTGSGTGAQSPMGNGGWGALENDAVFIDWANGSMNATIATPPATTVTRIGRNHAILVADSSFNQDYGSQANFSVDRDFSKGAWTSNFDVAPTDSCGSNSANCNYYSMLTELGSTPTYPLTISITGNGASHGGLSGAGNMNCAVGTNSIVSGTTITCVPTAYVGSGWVFTGWGGGTCSGMGTCSFSISGTSTVTANFVLTTAQDLALDTLTPAASPGGNSPGWNIDDIPANTGGVNTPAAVSQTIGNSTPAGAPSGVSMLTSATTIATSTQTNTLFWYYGAGADTATNFIDDEWIYVTNIAASDNIETDFNQYNLSIGRLFSFGHQCHPGGFWQYANNSSGWQNTAVTCSLSGAAWHHIIWTGHRVAGDTACSGSVACDYYDLLTVDGTTYTVNATLPSEVLPGGYPSALIKQVQVNIGPTSGSAATVSYSLDNMNFSAYIPATVNPPDSIRGVSIQGASIQ